MPDCIIKRTTTEHLDFTALVAQLDHELWNELNEDQATYDKFNKVPGIKTAVIVYADNKPAAIGCFKKHNTSTVEIKRMFTAKEFRGKCLSKKVLQELEQWAIELGYHYAVLETSIHFEVAINLYQASDYQVISNYDQYEGLTESVCMKKKLI